MGDKENKTVFVDAELEPIVPRFLELRYEDVESIGKLLEISDFESIKRIGHSMKGSGGGYGFDYISELGMKIERAAGSGDREEVRSLASQLSSYIERVEVVYE